MTALYCYVAAPYIDAGRVLDVHERLVDLGIQPTSTWARTADGPEDLSRVTEDGLRLIARANDSDLRGSHVVLVLARDGAGGEMFAEARIALEWGRPVVWVGRRILSAYRDGVVRVEDIDDALVVLARIRDRHIEGYRGQMLALTEET